MKKILLFVASLLLMMLPASPLFAQYALRPYPSYGPPHPRCQYRRPYGPPPYRYCFLHYVFPLCYSFQAYCHGPIYRQYLNVDHESFVIVPEDQSSAPPATGNEPPIAPSTPMGMNSYR